MTMREHLVYHLQEVFAIYRDALPLVDQLHHECQDRTLQATLGRQRERLRAEQEMVERALSVLGARYTLERNPMVAGMKEAAARFRRRLAPGRDELDFHGTLEMLMLTHLLISEVTGARELGQAIGEQDVVILLDETLQQRREDAQALRELLPILLQEMGPAEEERRAA